MMALRSTIPPGLILRSPPEAGVSKDAAALVLRDAGFARSSG